MHTFWGDTRSWLIAGLIAGGAIFLSLLAHRVVFALASRFFSRRGSSVAHIFVARAKMPALFIFPLIALVIALPVAPFPQDVVADIQRAIGLGIIFAIGWTAIVLLDVATDAIYSRYTVDAADNLVARRVRTQTELLRRIIVIVVMVVTVAIMLMTFPAVQHIGVSLLASAGLAGLVVGVAARSTLASLIAGIQVALTQPMIRRLIAWRRAACAVTWCGGSPTAALNSLLNCISISFIGIPVRSDQRASARPAALPVPGGETWHYHRS